MRIRDRAADREIATVAIQRAATARRIAEVHHEHGGESSPPVPGVLLYPGARTNLEEKKDRI